MTSFEASHQALYLDVSTVYSLKNLNEIANTWCK